MTNTFPTRRSYYREEQPGRVVAVGHPAGKGRADEVEDPHERKQARGPHLRQPVVGAERDEVGSDQAVGREAADEEGGEEQPEVAPADRADEPADRRPQRILARALLRYVVALGAIGQKAGIGGRSEEHTSELQSLMRNS